MINDNDRNPIIGARDWKTTETGAGFQAKFGQMSSGILVTECLKTSATSGQNFALIAMTKLP